MPSQAQRGSLESTLPSPRGHASVPLHFGRPPGPRAAPLLVRVRDTRSPGSVGAALVGPLPAASCGREGPCLSLTVPQPRNRAAPCAPTRRRSACPRTIYAGSASRGHVQRCNRNPHRVPRRERRGRSGAVPYRTRERRGRRQPLSLAHRVQGDAVRPLEARRRAREGLRGPSGGRVGLSHPLAPRRACAEAFQAQRLGREPWAAHLDGIP